MKLHTKKRKIQVNKSSIENFETINEKINGLFYSSLFKYLEEEGLSFLNDRSKQCLLIKYEAYFLLKYKKFFEDIKDLNKEYKDQMKEYEKERKDSEVELKLPSFNEYFYNLSIGIFNEIGFINRIHYDKVMENLSWKTP